MGRLSSVGTHLHFITQHQFCEIFVCTLATPSRAPPSFRLKVRTLALPGAGQMKAKREGEMMGGQRAEEWRWPEHPAHTAPSVLIRRVSSRYSTAAWRDFLGSIASSVFCKAVKEGSERVPQVRPHTGTILPGGRPCLSDPLGWCRTGASNKRC